MASESPPSSDSRLHLIREFLQGRRIPVFLGLVLSLLATVASLAVPMAVHQIVEAMQRGDASAGAVALMALLALSSALATGVATYLLARVGEQTVLNLRARIAAHVLRMPTGSVREHGTGNLVARMTSDSAQLRSVVDIGVTQIPGAALMVLGGLTVMFLLDWVLFCITLGAFSAVGMVVGFLVVGIRRGTAARQEAIAQLAQKFTATLGALPTIKAYRANRGATDDIVHSARHARDGSLAAARLQAMVNPLVELGLQIALVGVVVGSGARLASGALTIAEFAAFLLYLMQMIAPVTTVATGIGRLQTGLAARDRLDRVLTAPVETTEASLPPRADASTAVAFDDVNFAYDGNTVLDSVSLTVARQGMTALVGPSGAGKSTVLGIVEHFHIPQSGEVRVLGTPLSAWPLEELRRNLVYVDQECTLVEGTIRWNLLLGRDDVPDEQEVWAALDEVALRDTVAELPEGLDTVLGRATDLSGGQRQRLVLARALLHDGGIVLLDEPTSQMDSQNEHRLRETLERLAQDRAVLVVAHRISTVQNADHIVLLDNSGVADSGTHTELLARSTTYRDLVQGQDLTGAFQPV